MSDVSAVTNLLATVNEGFITTVGAAGVTSGGATVPMSSMGTLVNGTIFVGIIEPGATNQQVFTGTVDTGGAQITGVKWTRGTNVSHAAGATIVDYETGTLINMITKHLRTEHNQNGTHGSITASSLVASGAITAAGAVTGGSLVVNGATTLNGKVVPKVSTLASGATLTPDASATNICDCSGLATNTTIAAPTGTPANCQALTIRLEDNGTSRTIAWNAIYRAVGVTLPASTNASAPVYVGCIYNSNDTKWDVVSVGRG